LFTANFYNGFLLTQLMVSNTIPPINSMQKLIEVRYWWCVNTKQLLKTTDTNVVFADEDWWLWREAVDDVAAGKSSLLGQMKSALDARSIRPVFEANTRRIEKLLLTGVTGLSWNVHIAGSYVYINGGMIVSQFMSEVCSNALVSTTIVDVSGEWYNNCIRA
jgi:hypothetical protein